MFDRFTDRARKVMGLAWQRARHLGHDYIGTEHVLLGLLEEGGGVAADVLKNLDLDPQRIRKDVEGRIARGKVPDRMGQLPFTPRMKKALELALEEATSFGHSYIGTEHLLLGLFREEKGIAAQVLRAQGVGIEQARDEIRDLLAERPGEELQPPGPLDSRARWIMDIAASKAQQSGHDRIGTEHILIAMIEEAPGSELAGILLGRLRREIEIRLTPRAAPAAETPVSLTPGAKAALDLAFEEAGALGSAKVSSRHLVLGLLRQEDGIAAEALAAAGITREDVVEAPARAPGGAPGSPGRPPPTIGFDRFADRSRLVMGLARQEAQRSSHDYIGTEHILLGLVAAGGTAAAVLSRLGVGFARVREEVGRRVDPGNTMVTMGQLPFTGAAKRVLELALGEANAHGADAVREEHLLLGLVAEGKGVAAQALAALGVSLDALRKALGPPAPPE